MKNVISVTAIGCVFCLCAQSAFADPAIDAFNANRLDEAKTLFTQQLAKPEAKNTSLYYLASIEKGLGNFDKALDLINQALAIEPNSADEYFLLGQIYGNKAQTSSIFSALGLAKQCLNSFETAHKLDPANIKVLDALIGYHMGAPSIAGGSETKRDQYVAELKKLSPDHAAITEIEILTKNKEQDKATQLAKALYAKQPTDLAVAFSLGNYFKQNNFYVESEAIFEKLASVPLTENTSTDNRWFITDSYLQLGEVFLATHKQLERGISLVEDFQRANPQPKNVHYFWSWWSLAKLHKANGDMNKYNTIVTKIYAMNYKENKYFAQVFEAETKR